ncbi:hypothetical protein V3C99_009515 [Haemonchus contortus]
MLRKTIFICVILLSYVNIAHTDRHIVCPYLGSTVCNVLCRVFTSCKGRCLQDGKCVCQKCWTKE